jgi:hypothetical protein
VLRLSLIALSCTGCLLSGSDKPDGSDNPDDPPPMDDDPPPPPTGLRVFITSQNTDANLVAIGGAASGPESADVMCNNFAEAAGLPRTFTAWISDSTVDAIDRISANGPWVRMDGQMAFANKANLATSPRVPVTITEGNQTLMFPPDLINTWTGTGLGGRFTGSTCGDWTQALGKGTVGDAGETDGGWTSFDLLDCDLMGRLYCFEQ